MTAIGDWLKKLGACSEAIPSFENAAGIIPGVNSIKRPDWLLWFCFTQAEGESEKLHLLGALHKLMSGPILHVLANQPVKAAAAQALDDASKFIKGEPVPLQEAHAHHDALIGLKIPPHEKLAADLARGLLAMCLTQAGSSSGAVGAILATKWMRFLGVEGDEATLTATNKLRDALDFQGELPPAVAKAQGL
jgi:hypothetical protein